MRAFCSTVLLATTLLLTGCVAVNLHSARPVQVRVTERATGKAVTNADVSVKYGYTSYGVFRVFRVPEPASARTDTNGVAVLPLAAFSYDINFVAAGTRFIVTPDMILHGGSPSGSYWSGGGQTGEPLVEHPPPVKVQLTPTK